MDRATTGVVYFNFGTILNVTSIPKPSLRALINVLGRLEQKVVFRWINNDTSGFPDNFYVDSWLPQREILSNDNKGIIHFFLSYFKISFILFYFVYNFRSCKL